MENKFYNELRKFKKADDTKSVELEKIERQAIVEKFSQFDGNRTKTANALGIGRTNLIKKLKKYGLF